MSTDGIQVALTRGLVSICVLAAACCVVIPINAKNASSLGAQRRWVSDEALKANVDIRMFKRMLGDSKVFLLDTRPREAFSDLHVLGAYNIPVEELSMRMAREVPQDAEIVIYCGSTRDCEQGSLRGGKKTFCTMALDTLRREFDKENLHVLTGLLSEFQEARVPMQSSAYKLRIKALNSYGAME